MRVARVNDDTVVLILERGELVVETLTTYCTSHAIANAWLRGLGAVDQVRCGYYDLTSRDYILTEYPATYEVLQLSGNVMQKAGAPFIHLHATFSDVNNQCFGGHVTEMRVAVTLEVELTLYQTQIERSFEPTIGLFLIDPH